MEKKIIMYSQPTCGPCFEAKNWLAGEAIPHEVRDIRANPEYIDELLKMGANATPVFVVGKEVVLGFNKSKLQSAWKSYTAK